VSGAHTGWACPPCISTTPEEPMAAKKKATKKATKKKATKKATKKAAKKK
jgi:hypothetical protein